MTTIGDDDVEAVTIDGDDVQEITADGDVVWTAQTVVDDFESGGLGNYDSNPAGFDVQQGTVYEGTYALEAVANDSGTDQIYSSSGLNYYPQRGDVIELYVYRPTVTSGDRLMFGFAQQGASGQFWNDGYYVRCQDDRVVIREDLSSFMTDTRPGYTWPTNEWTRIVVDFGAAATDDISISHYAADGTQLGGTGTETNTSYDDGNIQFAATADMSSTYYIDSVVVPS